MEFAEAILLTIITASTPLLLAASGELVVERAGVLNLGVEGMMIVGAACGFGGAYLTGSIAVGALCGILGGMALSAVFALLTLGLAANQVASGLALTILGVGLAGLIGAGYVGQKIDGAAHLYIPYLTDIPFLGRVLLGQNAFVYFSIALIVAIWFFLYRTRAGLVLRAVGDNHTSAHALGYPVLKIRLLAVLFGGGCAGPRRRLSAARLYAVLGLGHDRRARLDRARARGVRLVAAVPPDDRRLSVRRHHHPAASRPGDRVGHSVAADVVAAVSRNHHRAGRDLVDARPGREPGAGIARTCIRTRPLSIVSMIPGTGFRKRSCAC